MFTAVLSALLVGVSFINIYLGMFPLINTDLLHLPLMYRDWAAGQLNWFFVNLPPSRYIFPDIPVYFALRSFIPDSIGAQLINTYLYYLLSAWLILANAKVWWGIDCKKALIPVLVAFAVMSIPGLFPQGVHFGLWWPTMHGGAIVICLINFALLGLYVKNSRKILYLVGLLVSGFALGFTDPLCFVLCLVPVLAILIFEYRLPRWRRVWLGALYVIMVAVGSWLGDRFVPSAFLQYLHQKLPAFSTISLHWGFFAQDLANPKVWAWIALLLAGTAAIFSLRRSARLRRQEAVGLLAILWVPLAAMLANARYMDVESVRYLSFSILVGFLCLLGWVWGQPRQARLTRWAPWALGLTLLICAIIGLSRVKLEQVMYPDFVKKLDSLKEKLGLKDGLADYETARQTAYFTHNGLKLNVVEEDASTFLKLGSTGWLGLSFTPPPALNYNFIVVKNDTISRDMMLLRYGQPQRIEKFQSGANGYYIWIYDYNLAEVMEFDPRLWSLMWDRLNRYGYLLSAPERRQVADSLLKVLEEANRIMDEMMKPASAPQSEKEQ